MKNLGIYEKVSEAIGKLDYDAIIAVGPDNVQYLGEITLPFLYSFPDRPVIVFWPRNGTPSFICPYEWGSSVRNNSWINKVYTYLETDNGIIPAVQVLSELIQDALGSNANIGLDLNRASVAFVKELKRSLKNVSLQDSNDWLKDLRAKKTTQEAKLLESVSMLTDHGIVGSAHHIIVTHLKTEMAFAEDVRVHCMERGLDTVGHHSMSQTVSGENAKKFWPLTNRYSVGWDKMLKPNELVRIGMTSSYDGYWSDANRMMVVGEPSVEQRAAFQGLVILREKAVNTIRPGVKCSEIFRNLTEEAKNKNINIVKELGVGHGIGVTSNEPPYLTENDDTVLKAGMILVIDPIVHGPDGEIMRSKDTVIVTDKGCKILGWYINWRAPYIAAYNL
jgi:Xaa-Pro dipeptidase